MHAAAAAATAATVALTSPNAAAGPTTDIK